VPVVLGIDQNRTPDLAGYPQLSVSATGNYVEFGMTFSPTAIDSRLNAQIEVKGGVVRIEQL